MDNPDRRQFLRVGGLGVVSALAGCGSLTGGGDDSIQDSDGDGVIDSEDYAPRDPDVQREAQVKGDDETPTPAETETPEPDDEPEESGFVAREALISHWPFESGLADVAGDNDVTADLGDPSFGTFDERPAVALDGDVGLMIDEGENAELSIAAPDSGGSTVTGWVYFDRETGGRPNEGEAIHHLLRNDDEYNFVAVPAGSGDNVEFRFYTGGYDTGERTSGELVVTTREWHHFVLAFEPESYLTFHVDGERVFHDDDMDGSNDTQTAYWSHETIGSWYGTGDPTWYDLLVGKLADLRIYDTALTDEQAAQVYANTS